MALRGDSELSVKYNHGQYCYLNAMEQVKDTPTADVVPKSEVEKEIKNWQELYADTVCKWEKAYEELEIKLENTKAEVTREIFDDIKCSILAMSTLALFSYNDNLEESNAKQKCYKYVSELIDELDKKYAEESR